jgi:hypothetical protein
MKSRKYLAFVFQAFDVQKTKISESVELNKTMAKRIELSRIYGVDKFD